MYSTQKRELEHALIMIIFDKDADNRVNRIVLIPNRSISWSLLLRFYIFTCCLSFSIAGLFAFLGYWVVMPFSGLEMLCLGAGLYLTCRKIYCQEVISISDEVIKIEKGAKSPEQVWEFDKHWVRLTVENKGANRKNMSIYMGSHGKFIEVGSFLTGEEKESLAFELNDGILARKYSHQS